MQGVGSLGLAPGQLSDPAGLVVDTVGNIIVADSRNHRLCLYNMVGEFHCNLSLQSRYKVPVGCAGKARSRSSMCSTCREGSHDLVQA